MSQQTILLDVNSLVAEAGRRVERLKTESQKLQQHWGWLAEAAKGAQTGTTGWVLGLTKAGRALKQAGVDFSTALETGYLDAKKLDAQLESVVKRVEELGRKRSAMADALGDAPLPEDVKRYEDVSKQFEKLTSKADRLKALQPFYHAQDAFLDKLKSVNVKFLALEGFLAGIGLKKAVEYSRQLNESLIAANSRYSERQVLMGQVLAVQSATGNSTQDMATAVKSLAEYGLQAHHNFAGILRTSVLLEEGLGVSYQTSAELANVWERRLQAPVKDAGDSLARIVDLTSLAGDKAARLAVTLGKAFANVGAGGTGLTKVIEQIVKLEGYVARQGGKEGELSALFARMQTTKGAGQAGMLGIGQPGQLATEDGAAAAAQRLARQVDNVTRSTREGSIERAAMLEALSEQYEVSTETLLALSKAVKDNNQATAADIDLERRWRAQVSNVGKSFERLSGSLQSLLHQGLLPILSGINWVSSKLADFIGWMSKFDVVIGAVQVLGMVAIPVAIYKVWSLVRSLFSLAAALHATAIAAARAGAATGAASAASASSGLGGLSKMIKDFKDYRSVGMTRAGALTAASPFLQMVQGSLKTAAVGAKGAATAGTLSGAMSTVAGIATVTAAVIASAAVGYAIGRFIDNKFGAGSIKEISVEDPTRKGNRMVLDAISRASAAGNSSEVDRLTKQREEFLTARGASSVEIASQRRAWIEAVKEGTNAKAGEMQRQHQIGDSNDTASLKAQQAVVEAMEKSQEEARQRSIAARNAQREAEAAKARQHLENMRLIENHIMHSSGSQMMFLPGMVR